MQLYFARHAQSVNNALESYEDYLHRRSDDPPLTDRGHRQADHLADLLAGDSNNHAAAQSLGLLRNPWNHEGFGITHMYCSRQRRAVETARPVSEAIRLPTVVWSDIHECGGVVRYDADSDGFVGAPGATTAALHQWHSNLVTDDDPASDDPADDEGWWGHRPMETREESAARAARVYAALLERHGGTDHHVLLVSHSMFYVYFMCEVLGIEFRNELWMTLHNTAITRLDIGDGKNYEPGMDAGWRRIGGLPVRLSYLNRVDHLPVELIS